MAAHAELEYQAPPMAVFFLPTLRRCCLLYSLFMGSSSFLIVSIWQIWKCFVYLQV